MYIYEYICMYVYIPNKDLVNKAVEKLKKAGRRGHLIDENYDTGEKPIYSPRRMHVFNSEKFSDIIEAQENEDSPDVVIDEDFTFEE